MTMRERFLRLGRMLDEDERELCREAASQDPGSKIERGLRYSSAFLDDYRRLLGNAAFEQSEDERAWRKAELHALWRARHPR